MIVECLNVNDTLKRIKVYISTAGSGSGSFGFENIPFENAEGLVEIDFIANDRFAKFPRPKTTAFMVDGDTETEITGYLTTITKEEGIIQSITLDGIFGTGYILLTN